MKPPCSRSRCWSSSCFCCSSSPAFVLHLLLLPPTMICVSCFFVQTIYLCGRALPLGASLLDFWRREHAAARGGWVGRMLRHKGPYRHAQNWRGQSCRRSCGMHELGGRAEIACRHPWPSRACMCAHAVECHASPFEGVAACQTERSARAPILLVWCMGRPGT